MAQSVRVLRDSTGQIAKKVSFFSLFLSLVIRVSSKLKFKCSFSFFLFLSERQILSGDRELQAGMRLWLRAQEQLRNMQMQMHHRRELFRRDEKSNENVELAAQQRCQHEQVLSKAVQKWLR